MKKETIILNLIYVFAIISLYLPKWFNGKFASILSIVQTIICDNLDISINLITIIGFLIPFYILYRFLFEKTETLAIKVILLSILVILILPIGAMLPPK